MQTTQKLNPPFVAFIALFSSSILKYVWQITKNGKSPSSVKWPLCGPTMLERAPNCICFCFSKDRFGTVTKTRHVRNFLKGSILAIKSRQKSFQPLNFDNPSSTKKNTPLIIGAAMATQPHPFRHP